MLERTIRYRYFMKIDKTGELKTEFYKFAALHREGEETLLKKDELILFLKKENIDIKPSFLSYIDKEIFKNANKNEYNCCETIILVARLSVPEDVEAQIKNVFDYFDQAKLGKLTAIDLR